MKKIVLYILLTVITIIIVIISLVVFNKRNDYKSIKKILSNTFFYLSLDEYSNMNDISDNCKISLLFDYDNFNPDKTLELSNYKVKGYSKSNILTSIRRIIGKNSTINFSLNEYDTYNFLSDNECLFNSKISNLTYNSTEQILYSDNMNNDINKIVLVNWDDIDTNGSIIKIKARALLLVKNEKDYSLFIDKDMNYKINDYKTINEAKKDALKNYIKSYKYEFEFYKDGKDYIWKSFKRKNDSSDVIVD